MIDPSDLNAPYTHTQNPKSATHIDVVADVMPIYQNQYNPKPPNRLKLVYDIVMLVLILVDLLLIFVDQIMMSSFWTQVAQALGFTDSLLAYKNHTHFTLATLGGMFTLFLIGELLVRWAIAIHKKTYYRWFFFPFVHWYEVLGCFPLLRPLRLLRAVIIIKRLHDMRIQVVPEKWIKTAKFYTHILLEELSDRVILTAVGNFRMQLNQAGGQNLIQSTLHKNQQQLQHVLSTIIAQNLHEKLQQLGSHPAIQELPQKVGGAIEQALLDTPEFRRYLKMIPIAGGLIEGQVLEISKKIGQNATQAACEALLSDESIAQITDALLANIAHVGTVSPEVLALIEQIVQDGLSAFEEQVKIQQWKHTEHLHF